MDIFKQNKILIWIIILLVVINLGTITGTWILHFNKKTHHEMVMPQHSLSDRKGPIPGRFEMLGLELKFDNDQMEKFNEMRTSHHKQMKILADKINELKKQILNEVVMSEPDSVKLENLYLEIGQSQLSVEKEIFKHFKNIKTLCNTEQKNRFDNLIKDILAPDRIPPPPLN